MTCGTSGCGPITEQELQLKSIALVPLAALAILIISLPQDWVWPRLEARMGWDPLGGFDFNLNVALEIPIVLEI
jgi:hypothetical protein